MIISDFQKKRFSRLIPHKVTPGVYTNKGLAETVYPIGNHEGSLKIEYDAISKKTKPNLKTFGGTFGTFRYIERSFFITLLGFSPNWDYKPTNTIHVDSPGVYTSEKILK